MFFNLAWRNSKRNRSENLIYFLTMVTAVATFYIVLSLGNQDVMRFLEEIESDAVNRLLTMLMPTVYLFFATIREVNENESSSKRLYAGLTSNPVPAFVNPAVLDIFSVFFSRFQRFLYQTEYSFPPL